MQSGSHMMFVRRRIAAADIARHFVETAQTFADTFVQYIAVEDASVDAAVLLHRRRETCAAAWAAIVATFDASGFTETERTAVLPLVRQALIPFWQKHCGRDEDLSESFDKRAVHYLRGRDPDSQLKTAARIMNEVVSALDPDAARLLPVRTLTALLAHRMLSDLRRLGEIKASYTIE